MNTYASLQAGGRDERGDDGTVRYELCACRRSTTSSHIAIALLRGKMSRMVDAWHISVPDRNDTTTPSTLEQ